MRELQLSLPDGAGRRSAIEVALRDAIRRGRLAHGSELPSSRTLAADLGVSRSTIVGAYEQLTAEGFLISEHGRGTRVAEVSTEQPGPTDDNPLGPVPTHDFRPGEPDASAFPRREFLRSMRRVLDDAPDEVFGYPDPRGRIELRRALVEYLGRTRSVRAEAAALHIHGGFAAALGFLADALRHQGHERIAIEHGALPLHRQILRIAGLQVDVIGVDADGLQVDELAQGQARAVLVTPANQYPHGVTLSPARRSDLVAWANDCDGWIIEDDYDGEFRYDRRPIGALQGLDPGRVVYAGTASKSLSAGLRMGWVVVPEGLRGPLQRATHIKAGVSTIDQLALADFIGRGQLDRQVRLMRRRYQQRQLALRDMLAEAAPTLTVGPSPAGLQLFTTLPAGMTEAPVLAAAERASIGLFGLHTHHGIRTGPQGFVIGFSRIHEHAFAASLERLRALLADALR